MTFHLNILENKGEKYCTFFFGGGVKNSALNGEKLKGIRGRLFITGNTIAD